MTVTMALEFIASLTVHESVESWLWIPGSSKSTREVDYTQVEREGSMSKNLSEEWNNNS